MDVSVIICTWNRCETLRAALVSLEASVTPAGLQWEVLVVDNNSTDGTRAVCQAFAQKNPARFRYLFEPQQGKTHALNSGIREARGEIIALTDDDVTVDPNWVAEIHAAFQKYDCAAIGGKTLSVWKSEKPSWIDLDSPNRHPGFGGIVHFNKGNQPFELRCTVPGVNMAVRKSIFEKYGRYRPDLNRSNNLLGGEDTEYCRRMMRGGERLYYVPQALVYHPVEEHRTKPRYLLAMAFDYGRWIVRIDGVPENAVCYFGVPRYLFPKALRFFGKWLGTFGARERFFYKLELYLTLGEIKESRAMARNRRANAERQLPESARLPK